MKNKILNWLANGRVGLSSKAMAMAVAKIDCNDRSHSSDPDDLNRCLLFLHDVPDARDHLSLVAELSDYWGALIARFEEVESCFLAEAGLNWCKAQSDPKTYELMREIIKPIQDT